MSIPPLVCSTPPPPDQCEDEKVTDDFDIGYNLSQDYEDQNPYEFNDFCTFNTFKSPPSPVSVEDINTSLPKNIVSRQELIRKNDNPYSDHDQIRSESSPLDERIKKVEEDNVEDLDLNFEEISINIKESSKESDKRIVDSDSGLTDTSTDIDQTDTIECSPTFGNDTEVEILNSENDRTEKDVNQNHNIQDNEILNNDASIFSNLPNLDQNESEKMIMKMEPTSTTTESTPSIIHEVISGAFTEKQVSTEDDTDQTFSNTQSNISIDVNSPFKTNGIPETCVDSENYDSIQTVIKDDDFGDFNNFEVTTSLQDEKVVDTINSPWASDNLENLDFEANFDNIENTLFVANRNLQLDIPSSTLQSNENDQFDDFDDFKSSDIISNNVIDQGKFETGETKEVPSSHSSSALDIQLSHTDTQVTEIVDKVLSSVFEEEIAVTNNNPERALSTFLCETWGHLIEADIRQPYMLNWNNSLAQKTLLKALCIDSRNILFGPKWSHNMPKYASNLGSSPLQPQKPNTSAASVNDATTRITENWVEPFNVEGQEFTYAEALLLDLENLMATLDQMAHNHSALKISDLLSNACNSDNGTSNLGQQSQPDDFAQKLSSKSEKIYPNTLKLQPIRQISLPDTHIYTPTDSDIPRSKTIHYGSGTPQLPQSTSDINKTSNHNVLPNDVDDDEYSDFQDFQCGTNTATHTVKSQSSDEGRQNSSIDQIASHLTKQITIPFESRDVLQPIKVEPIIPTLNWPDPGEVKETFDNFSDFVTSPVWDNSKENVTQDSINSLRTDLPLFDTIAAANSSVITAISQDENSLINKNISISNIDDEFDTFQSAAPISNNSKIFQTLSTDVKEIRKTLSNDPIQQISPEHTTSRSKDFQFSNFVSIEPAKLQYSNAFSEHPQMKGHDPITQEFIRQSEQSSSITSPVPAAMKTTPITLTPVTESKILQPIPANVVTSQSKQPAGQILQPLSLESYTQINWPNPGVSLQDLSAFNPVKTLHTIQAEASGSHSKGSSPSHVQKSQATDDDGWGEFVSIKSKSSQPTKKQTFADDDEWSDFVSSPSVNPHNGLNTISLNVHTNLNLQKSLTHNKFKQENKQIEIPTLNYITPKSNSHRSYSDRHFQNL